MEYRRQTVTEQAMQSEWREIQQAQVNPAAFRGLYDRYYDPIFRFIYRRTADERLTADLCSQVFLKALQRLKSYRFRGVPFSAWLYRIAANEVNQHYREVGKNRIVSIEDRSLHEISEELEDERAFGIEDMIAQIGQLKPADVEILELRYFEGRPFKEVAEILEITESNAKVRTYRVLERLKKLMLRASQNESK